MSPDRLAVSACWRVKPAVGISPGLDAAPGLSARSSDPCAFWGGLTRVSSRGPGPAGRGEVWSHKNGAEPPGDRRKAALAVDGAAAPRPAFLTLRMPWFQTLGPACDGAAPMSPEGPVAERHTLLQKWPEPGKPPGCALSSVVTPDPFVCLLGPGVTQGQLCKALSASPGTPPPGVEAGVRVGGEEGTWVRPRRGEVLL